MTPYLLPALCLLLCGFRDASSTGLGDQLDDALKKYFETMASTNPTTEVVRDHSRLIDEEPILIDTLWKYIESENSRLDELHKFRDALMENAEASEGLNDIAHNPLSIFIVVKRLTVDLDGVNRRMKKNSYYDIVPGTVAQQNLILPDENDLYDEIRDLVSLQRVYNFGIRDLINGFPLTAEDCFYIGKRSSEKHDHETAVKWLRECEDMFTDDVRDQVHKILISSALFVGDYELSRQMVENKLRADHNHRALNDLKLKLMSKLGNWYDAHALNQYESFNTCAGDYDESLAYRNLKCRYNHHNSPFLIIAPLKEEMLSFEPKVSIFREVVFDSEIELLLTEAYDMFRPASVINAQSKTGWTVDLDYRPSRTTFLNNAQAKYVSLWNRLQDMGPLSLKHSEFFQMLHYASGGFYRVHADYNIDLPEIDVKGNRVATALMYLNSVPAGGETVFPHLRLKVQPIKGSVLFWLNMRADGSEETFAIHAACPVYYGEKLACTQWYRSRGQDHWIVEPEGDKKTHYFTAQNTMSRGFHVNTTKQE